MKKFSVIIPTYNRAKVIEFCIMSVVNQGYSDLEILVCDDFSNDNTKAIVEKISCDYDYVRYLIRKDGKKGANAARNNGIKNASGEFLLFLDSDDILCPESIKVRLDLLEKHADIDMVYGNVKVSHTIVRFEKIQNFEQKKYLMRELSLCPFSVIMVRRESLRDVPLLDTELLAWQDDDFILQLAIKKKKMFHCGKVVAEMTYGAGEENITCNFQKRYLGCKKIVKKYKNEIISEQSEIRYVLWKLRVLLDWLAAKSQNSDDKISKYLYNKVYVRLYNILKRYFYHIYG